MYEDQNHGLFSKRLAEWAIGKMRMQDASNGLMSSAQCSLRKRYATLMVCQRMFLTALSLRCAMLAFLYTGRKCYEASLP